MSELSHSDIQHLARLARLDLTQEEYERYATQLTSVVNYVDTLSKVDTSKVETLIGIAGLTNVLAVDEHVEEFFDREAGLNAAPRRDGEYIEVRAVMGGEVVSA
jgi:aspartyl-tRNA(Asn)/glutamyl-tRNA(Gln) amidotransferase subunit C